MIAKTLNSSITLLAFVSLLITGCGSDNADNLLSSAKEYLSRNDSKAAVIQLKNALQKSPDFPEARYLLGRSLLESGDPIGAEVELRKALELKHARDMVMPELARALLAQGQYRKLTDEMSGIDLAQPAAKADLQTTLASAYAAQGKSELSQSALRIALLAEPDHAPALIATARYKAAQRDFDDAMAIADEVVAKSPGSYEAWKLKGDIALHVKRQPTEALVAYQKALAIKSDFLPAHFGILGILLQQGKREEVAQQLGQLKKLAPNHPQTKYIEAQLAFQQRDFKLARELSQQMLMAAGNNPNVLQLAGAVEFQLNSMAQAETYLSKAIQIAPEFSLARRLLITTYLRMGQPAKALATLPEALTPNGSDANMLSAAGQVYLQNGDVKKAEEFFASAVRLDPKDGRKRTSLAMTHLMKGEADSAFGELQDISAADSGTTADFALVSAYLRRSEFGKALKAIDALEKKQPANPLHANLRGRIHLAQQDNASARRSFEQALAIDATYFPAVASLAAMDMADKKPEDAKKRFESVLAKDPKNAHALLALAELRARAGGSRDEIAELINKAVAANPTEASPRLVLIGFHMSHKDLKQATAAAQNAVAALPTSTDLLDAMGRVQMASGETNQAIATYNKLVGMQPLSPIPHLRLADVYMAAKNRDAARQSLDKALEIKPDLLEAQRALIILNLDGQKYQEALTMARRVQKQRPKEVPGYVFEGDIDAAQRKWESAAAAYRAGLKQVPASVLAVKLHTVLAVSGKTAEAEKLSANWIKDHPKDATFVYYLADSALMRGDLKVAEKHFLAVVGLQPNNALALNNLAWVTGQLGKEGAIAYAENANKLMPNQPPFMDTLAMLLSEKNQYAKAVELQNKAVGLQPDNTLFKLNLAKIHIKGGQKELARAQLAELAKLGDRFPRQTEVSNLLNGLGL